VYYVYKEPIISIKLRYRDCGGGRAGRATALALLLPGVIF